MWNLTEACAVDSFASTAKKGFLLLLKYEQSELLLVWQDGSTALLAAISLQPLWASWSLHNAEYSRAKGFSGGSRRTASFGMQHDVDKACWTQVPPSEGIGNSFCSRRQLQTDTQDSELCYKLHTSAFCLCVNLKGVEMVRRVCETWCIHHSGPSFFFYQYFISMLKFYFICYWHCVFEYLVHILTIQILQKKKTYKVQGYRIFYQMAF